MDSIIVGGLKLYVNLPRYRRLRGGQPKPGGRRQAQRQEKKIVDTNHTHRGGRTKKWSYAEAVAGRSSEGGSSSIHIEPTERTLNWLKDAWVGRLSNPTMFDKAEDELRWDYGLNISTTYLGDDMILIIGLNEERAEQLLKELNQRTPPLLYSLQKWSSTLRPGNRLAWVQCWGIPAIIWDDLAIKKILGLLGDVLELEEEVEEQRRMDRAKVLLKTPWKPFIHHTVNVHVGSEVYEVSISEERGPNDDLWNRMRRNGTTSSDEIPSDCSFMESPILEKARSWVFVEGRMDEKEQPNTMAQSGIVLFKNGDDTEGRAPSREDPHTHGVKVEGLQDHRQGWRTLVVGTAGSKPPIPSGSSVLEDPTDKGYI